MKQNISEQDVRAFMRKYPIMSIAVADGDQPMSSIVLFAMDDDFTLYFSTGSKSYKSKALAHNNKISFSVWEFGKLHVQGYGTAAPLTDEAEADAVLDKITISLSRYHDFWPPVAGLWGQDYVLFKVKTDWVKAMDLSKISLKEPNSPFTEFRFT